ncbi:hypothetical protein ACS0TY_014196 [Phlomoides rotata]
MGTKVIVFLAFILSLVLLIQTFNTQVSATGLSHISSKEATTTYGELIIAPCPPRVIC